MANTAIRTAEAVRLDAGLRNLLAQVIRDDNKKRTGIVEEMKARGFRVSLNSLNDYTALSKERMKFPLLFVQPFCEVVGDDRLQRFVLSPRLRELLRLGEAAAEILDERTQGRLVARKRRRPGRGKR